MLLQKYKSSWHNNQEPAGKGCIVFSIEQYTL